MLYTCSNAALGCVGEQTDVAVRQALNVAIDRCTIKEKAFVGLTRRASRRPSRCSRATRSGSPTRPTRSARSRPTSPRPERSSRPPATPRAPTASTARTARAIELDLVSVDGWTDYNDAAKLIAEQAAEAGIKVNASTVQWQEFSDARQTGQFELIMGGVIGTSVADPYQIYDDWFAGDSTLARSARTSSPGEWNFSRYDNPIVNDAVAAAAATNDEAAKKAAYATIQTEIVRDLPYIPIVINATQTFYNSKDFTGWPTEDDLYAFPPAWGSVVRRASSSPT